jgi:hypothetical protein
MSENNKINRRKFLAVTSGAATTATAGCLGGGKSGNGPDNQSDTGRSTDSKTGSDTTTQPQNSTNGESQGEPEGNDETGISRLLEEDESEIEKGEEREIMGTGPVDTLAYQFVEFHNPNQQIPEENIDTERYPSLEPQEELANLNTDDLPSSHKEIALPYDSGEDVFAQYLQWRETSRNNTKLIVNFVVENENGELHERSLGYAEGSSGAVDADVEGILENVVEDVSDVSENLEDKYVNILLDKYD